MAEGDEREGPKPAGAFTSATARKQASGSSPRVRGTPACGEHREVVGSSLGWFGSSPRVRGTLAISLRVV
jgi:hypothetical protein